MKAQANFLDKRWASSTRAASTSAHAWTRPIAEGVNPAYDAALELLDGHSQKLFKRAEALRSQSGQTEAEIADLQRRAKILEVEARIIDPRLRSTFTSAQEVGEDVEEGEADALRTLAERKWRKEGRLDRLMQRVIQMNVIPDLIPRINPTIDLAVSFGDSPAATGGEPGAFLLPSQTTQAPSIKLQVFEKDAQESLYTLVMVDPDFPDAVNHTFKQYAHWIIPNIPITPRTTSIPTELTEALPYQPPHPSTQTPYHRYTLLLIRQPSSTTPLTPTIPEDRSSFILRDWLSENGFGDPADAVRGLHMFREGGKGFGRDLRDIADEHKTEVEAVRKIYSEVLGGSMPTYVKVPKDVRYGKPTKR
ncbi:hypothetical protein QFC21_003401 [Naganishia friedmannii]|uniref:Uncharacterized protein n=1 Tax=Naganishia friedmannii TaxID=89922 RepID=A0ACC2VPE7_9TREE|nr:hypothetical protein QFC21_003401 [Naganishia friedmannii]